MSELRPIYQCLKMLEAKNNHLKASEKNIRQITNILQQASLALAQTFELDTILDTLLTYLAKLVPYDTANVMLLQKNGLMMIRAMPGYEQWSDPAQVRKITFNPYTTPTIQELVTKRQPVLIADTQNFAGWTYHPETAYIRSWLGIPLIAGGDILGMYSMDQSEKDIFTQAHADLAETLAAHAAVAIQNARLHKAAQSEITERRRAEGILRESEKRFRDLFTNSPDAIFVQNKKGNVLNVNAAACQLYGLTYEQLISKNVADLVPPETRQSVKSIFSDIISGKVNRLEGYSWTADGHKIPVEIRSSLITYAGEEAILLHVRDITGRKQAEAKIRQHQDHLEELVMERTALIQSFKQVAVDQSTEERRLFRVKSYLAEVLLTLKPRLKQTQLTIEIYGEDDLKLDSYPGIFSQIITNLVINSLIHGYETGEKRRLVFAFQQCDDYFVLRYTDDGRGIAPENLRSLLHYQARSGWQRIGVTHYL